MAKITGVYGLTGKLVEKLRALIGFEHDGERISYISFFKIAYENGALCFIVRCTICFCNVGYIED